MGCEVDVAENGKIGVEKRKNGEYSLIFTDLKMPEMNGTEAIMAIRQMDKDTPIYVVTAFHKDYLTELKDVKEQGFKFELLQKPIGNEEICAIATNILNGPTSY